MTYLPLVNEFTTLRISLNSVSPFSPDNLIDTLSPLAGAAFSPEPVVTFTTYAVLDVGVNVD